MPTNKTQTIVVAGAFALSLLACRQDDRDAAPAAAVRDSSGVEIVQNTAAAWRPGEEWQLSAEPLLDIGAVHGDPNYEFGSAHSPVRLSDGRIVVADAQANLMRFYHGTGKFLKSAGGSGEGPGEFTQLYRMRKIAGDSLMALNPISLTSIFSPNGEYIRRFQLNGVPGRGNIWWIGSLSDGVLLAFSLRREGTRDFAGKESEDPRVEHPRFVIPEKSAFYRDSLLHFLYTMDGELIDSIAKLPGQWLGDPSVLAPNAAYAFFDDLFYHSPGNVVEIRKFRSRADRRDATANPVKQPNALIQLERIILRSPLRDTAVTEEDKQKYFAEQRKMYERMAARDPEWSNPAFIARQLASVTFPTRMPAHGNRMYADAQGNLWLQEYRIGTDEPFRWSIFDPDGQWLGMVETPPTFTVNEIGEDYVLGIWRDSLDVQYVRMYALEKPRLGTNRAR